MLMVEIHTLGDVAELMDGAVEDLNKADLEAKEDVATLDKIVDVEALLEVEAPPRPLAHDLILPP